CGWGARARRHLHHPAGSRGRGAVSPRAVPAPLTETMALYLVTGAAGFIGSGVARQLLDRGDQVVGVDDMNDAYDTRLKDWRLGELRKRDGFHFEKFDIAERDPVRRLFEQHDFARVLNLAARAGV